DIDLLIESLDGLIWADSCRLDDLYTRMHLCNDQSGDVDGASDKRASSTGHLCDFLTVPGIVLRIDLGVSGQDFPLHRQHHLLVPCTAGFERLFAAAIALFRVMTWLWLSCWRDQASLQERHPVR